MESILRKIGSPPCRPRLMARIGIMLVLMSTRLFADNIDWTGAVDTDFNTGGNWAGDQVPGTNDNARFLLAGSPYTVTWSSPATNKLLTVTGSEVVFDFQGRTYRICPVSGSCLSMTTGAKVLITNGSMVSTNSLNLRDFYDGAGTRITVQNALVHSQILYLRTTISSFDDSSTLVVNGSDSEVRVEQEFRIGSLSGASIMGWGSLIVTNGGLFSAPKLTQGTTSGYQWFTVADEGSIIRFTNTELQRIPASTADSWTGSVHIANGGAFEKPNGDLSVEQHGTISISNGTLKAKDFITVHSNGVIEGAGTVDAGSVLNMGTVRVGGADGIGELTVTGSFTNTHEGTNGVMEIQLGGLETNQYDRLSVGGNLHAAGTLKVSLVNGLQNQNGGTFKILDFESSTGAFNTLDLPGGEGSWNVRDLYITGEIRSLLQGTVISIR